MKKTLKAVYNFVVGSFLLLIFYCFTKKKIREADVVCSFPFYHTGGAEKVHLDIVKALHGKKVCVIFTLGSATINFLEGFTNNSSVIEINNILNKRNSFLTHLLQKIIINSINKNHNISCLFGCNSVYYYQLLTLVNQSIKKIDLFHNFLDNDSRENDIVQSAQFINNRVVINNAAKQDVLAFYEKNNVDKVANSKIIIIGNGVEITSTIFKFKNNATFNIGYVGRWCDEKRPMLFLEIAKKIKAEFPLVNFIMAGTGMRNNLDLINKAGVEFKGEITNKDSLSNLYDSLHFLVLPSTHEGFPMVMMESMNKGVVPISTNLDGICEHITHNQNGILINHTYEDDAIVFEFITAIKQLLLNPSEMHRISQNAFDYSIANFNINSFNEKYRALLLQ